MYQKINALRDKGRKQLYRLSQFLGETAGVTPVGLNDSSNAHRSLELDLPSIKTLLAYESITEDGIFINKQSAGFGLEIAPASGADETLMKSIAELFKNKLPAGLDCTVILYKHPYLNDALQSSFAPIIEQGGIYGELAKKSFDFHYKAIEKGYKNDRNIPAQLVDYRCYFFISMPKRENCDDFLRLVRCDFESEIKVAGLGFARLSKAMFNRVMRSILSPNDKSYTWPIVEEHTELLSEKLAHPSTLYEIGDNAVDISMHDENGNSSNVRVVSCEITALPKDEFALWQTPDLFANILRPECGIQCPFLISFTVRGTNREAMKALAKRRASSLQKNNNGFQRFLNPTLADEVAEWGYVHQEIAKDNLDLLPTFYNVVLFTSKASERHDVAKAIASFRQLDFTLMPSRCKQWLRFLGSLPFLLTDGLFSRFEILGLIKKLSHYNVANLLPIVADFKGCNRGLLLPTYRHQLFYYDPFDDKNLPITNFNRLTVASTGAGKSYFQQALLLDGLSRGQQIFVIDLGASYKHLCEMVGGTYIDATTIVLNPFTLFDFDGTTEIAGEKVNNYIQIRDLLAIMASPTGNLDEVQKTWLLDAILMSWREKSTDTCIDDVLTALRVILQKPEARNDRRLKDLIILLGKFGREGIYGAMFNGKTPLLNDSKFTVLELGGFESNPELLTIVMFVMIVIIQGQFYHGDRRLQKQCNFDEMWRAFQAGSNPIGANFLEVGYRTARKYNAGFSAITQDLNSTQSTLQGQAIAACCDTKIIMRQGDFQNYINNNPKVFNPLQQQMIASFGEAKAQGFSNLMIQYGSHYTFHRYFSDPFSRILFSTSGDEFGEIEARLAQGESLTFAIDAVAKKYYGEAA